MNQQPTCVALVSGGAKGIGAAIAARLSRDGWRVVIADRAPSGAAPFGGRYVECDVADEEAVSALLRSVGAVEQRLDALICNAGFMIRMPLADLSLAEWSSVLATNLTSTFLLVRAAEPLLRAAKGVIVTIASSRARMSEPDTESYSASKGGLVALTYAGDQPWTGCPGKLHQSGLDSDQGAGAERRGTRIPPRRARWPR
jgi:NAD(P)-dependent dehydrogenase (short-subunit alcohol dehydrogenase family)